MNLFKKIDHIELVVGDLERAKEFYAKLGPMVRHTTHHGGSAEFLVGDTLFEIHQVGAGGRVEENPGLDHISFLVEGDKEELEKVRKTLVSKGIEVTDVHLVKATGRYLINFRDSDGYRLQANTEPDPDLVVEGEV
jgi:catechol 2,3-dioxygenase-like lactoylglutathione lyase family enzyme